MQGGSFPTDVGKTTHLKSFMKSGFDCICIQECTQPLPSFDELVEVDSTERIRVLTSKSSLYSPSIQYYCYFLQWGIGNSRCSMAVYAKNKGAYKLEVYSDNARPMLVVNLGCCIVGNVHLTSGHQEKALDEFKYYQHMVGGYSRKIPTFIVGDFNMNLDFITKNFPSELKKFHHVNSPTHKSDKILDYVYCGNEDINIEMGIFNKLYSDHFSILAEIG